MADEQDQPEEELLLDEPLEGADQPEPANDDEGDEFAIEIEGDEAAEEETPLIRDLRQKLRAEQKEKAELRKALAPVLVEVGDEPTLEGCEWDEDRFKAEIRAYEGRKVKRAQQEVDADKVVEVRNQEFTRRFTDYRAKAAVLPVRDFADAEKAVIATLPVEWQSAIVRYAKDPSKVVYALYKHPARMSRIAEMGDLGDVIVEITDMERSLKVVNKRKPPAPEAETIVTGSAQNSGSTDKMAEKLLSDAAKGVPGAMQKYRNHMKQKRAA